MTTDIGSVVGKIVLIESPQSAVPFIDVIGENHTLVPVADGKYFEKATEIAEKVGQLESIAARVGHSVMHEGPKTRISHFGKNVHPGDPEYPYAVANYCKRYNLALGYEPTPQDTDQ